jgi:hypothetical protein
MPAPFALLGAARVNGIMAAIQDPRLLPPELRWRQRIPVVPAADDELLATFNGQLLIADLIADDARAVTYSMGQFRFTATKIPNIKMGISMNQTMLNSLNRIASNLASADDLGIFEDWENRTIEAALNGVELRRELLLTAMLNDGLTYDRLGIKMNNVTFGMPADLKVTVGTGWDNIASTPITDIQTIRRLARVRYGIELNRLTASSAALYYATLTTEFQNQARTYGWGFGGIPMPAAPIQSDAMLTRMLERIIGGGDNGGGFTIEIDDRRYWAQDNNGNITSAPFQPVNRVLLTDSRNDGNSQVMDLANSIPTETIVASVTDEIGIIGGFDAPARGPVAYVTGTHNSPSLTYWGVARSFPRKHMKQASATLNVGSFVDPIPLNVPPV